MIKLNGNVLTASGKEKAAEYPVYARLSGFTMAYLDAIETDEADLIDVIALAQATIARKAGNGNTRVCGMSAESATILTTAIEDIAKLVEGEHGKGYSLVAYNLRYDNQRILDQIK